MTTTLEQPEQSNLALSDTPKSDRPNDGCLKHPEQNALSLSNEARSKLFNLEQAIAKLPSAVFGDNDLCPLKHSFANGIYMREIFIPAGAVLTGKIHRHAHPNVLLEGEAVVFTEHGGTEHLKAPLAMISLPATKRAVLALTDLRWLTFHNVGEERDLAKIEDIVIAKTYEQLEAEQQGLLQKGDA